MTSPSTPPAPDGPDEGHYDPRVGAGGYAPLVGTFGALAVTAIVVLLSSGNKELDSAELALATGWLAVGVFGSVVGSFGLAATAAERDPTANLAGSILYLAVAVAVAILSVLAAFQVLADAYINGSAWLFKVVVVAGALYAVNLIAAVLGDSPTLYPRTMNQAQFSAWLQRQWLQNRADAYRASTRFALWGSLPILLCFVIRLLGVHLPLRSGAVNIVVTFGLVLCLASGILGISRSKHPVTGNNQVSVKRTEAAAVITTVSFYTSLAVLLLP